MLFVFQIELDCQSLTSMYTSTSPPPPPMSDTGEFKFGEISESMGEIIIVVGFTFIVLLALMSGLLVHTFCGKRLLVNDEKIKFYLDCTTKKILFVPKNTFFTQFFFSAKSTFSLQNRLFLCWPA
jgi:hypothetical protein